MNNTYNTTETCSAAPAKAEPLRMWELSRSDLADMLQHNTKALDQMVKRYNAVLADKTALEEENRKLRNEISAMRETQCYRSKSATDAISIVMKALNEYNLMIEIEPRKTWDE